MKEFNQTPASVAAGEMLLTTRKYLCLHICALIFSLQQQYGESSRCILATPATPPTTTTSHLLDEIFGLLDRFEQAGPLDINIKFAALLAEFLIKQKVRFHKSNRYEDQLYYNILQKLNAINEKPLRPGLEDVHKRILQNIFQRDVLLRPPALRAAHIDTHSEYKSLAAAYSELVGTGRPNGTMSDSCLAEIVTLSGRCGRLRDDCMSVIATDLPTYGYQRLHQILLLYVFIHHQCARSFGSQSAYELLASQKCTEVYREHNVIRSFGIPARFRDLYLEQNVVCGLFGYAEFVNWRTLEAMLRWGAACSKTPPDAAGPACDNHHLNSLALVYYINALLLLE